MSIFIQYLTWGISAPYVGMKSFLASSRNPIVFPPSHIVSNITDATFDFKIVYQSEICGWTCYHVAASLASLIQKLFRSNRHYFVTYNGVNSCKQVIGCGVPQGSIFSELLFLDYINDLSAAHDHSQPFLFADDTNLFISGKNTCQLQQNMRSDLMSIAEWLKADK